MRFKLSTVKTMHRCGFTLMEVLTGMVLISIVSSIVLPGMDNFYSSIRVTAAAELFVQSFRLAKYRAMQDQTVHRIIFADDLLTFKTQIHAPPLTTTESLIVKESQNYDSTYWESISDTDEETLDEAVELSIGTLPKQIFFWPDGQIHTSPIFDPTSYTGPFGEHFVTFTYGSSAIRVNLNAIGILSSEAYAVDLDDAELDEETLWKNQ